MKWISVNDRFSAKDELVLIFGDNNYIVGYYSVESDEWLEQGYWTLPFKPTHWMPLPPPPKTKFPSIEKQPTQSDFEALQTVQDVLTDEQALEALK